MKKQIQHYTLFIFILLSSILVSNSSYALVDDTTCTVTNSEDNTSSPSYGSLRRKVVQGFNRPSNRFCIDLIKFEAGRNYNIVLSDTLAFTYSDSTLTVDGAGTSVVIDAVAITREGKCAIQLDNGDSHWKNITLRVDAAHANLAFCGSGQGTHHNDGENGFHVEPVGDPNNQPPQNSCNSSDGPCCNNGQWRAEGDACEQEGVIDGHCNAQHQCVGEAPDCDSASVCCNDQGNFDPAATPCTDANGASGACDGSGTCVPTPTPPVPQCLAGSTCCDNTGHYQSSGTACTDVNGAAGACNGSGVCLGTSAPECVPGIGCCDSTGHWMAEGASCDDGNANTSNDQCSASHQCAGTPASTEGNNSNNNNNNNGNNPQNPSPQTETNSPACSGASYILITKAGGEVTKCGNPGGCSLAEGVLLYKGHYFMAFLSGLVFTILAIWRRKAKFNSNL